ncbi:hypothetical protein HPB47_008549, partial [Ixodes persulcatus]
MLGHDIKNLPDLPQLSPPWKHIMLTDFTPLPQHMPPEQVERRRTFVNTHIKWTQTAWVEEDIHIVYMDAASEEIFKARHYRRAYLLATANPLLAPFPLSRLFSRRQLVTLRQIQTGTILTPYALQWFRQHSSSHREKGTLCHKNADLEHLLWDCPLYSEPRTRTLATIQQSFRPTSLHTWACPDPSFPKVTAIELWRSLLAYTQDPAAPLVGARIQGTQLSTTEPRQNTKPEPTVHLSSDAVAPTGPTEKNGGPLSPA